MIQIGEKPSNAALRGFKKSRKNVTFSQKHTTQPKIKVFFLHGKLLRKQELLFSSMCEEKTILYSCESIFTYSRKCMQMFLRQDKWKTYGSKMTNQFWALPNHCKGQRPKEGFFWGSAIQKCMQLKSKPKEVLEMKKVREIYHRSLTWNV